MRRRLYVLALFLTLKIAASGEALTFKHVKIHRHRNKTDRALVDKVGALTFDDYSHRLVFDDLAGDKLEVAYGNVIKVVFEVTTHMRGGALAQVIGGVPGALIARRHVNDYWMYVECKNEDASGSFLLEIPRDESDAAIKKTSDIFGARATEAKFEEQGAEFDALTLRDIHSKQTWKIDRRNHPIPEIKPDKALVVVACPALAARYYGKSNQFKLHANDRVIAVNKMGTYSFVYLDPGEYALVSQAENLNGFRIQLDAGKGYYFLQNTFQGQWKAQTVLSRNTRELVMYQVDGSYYSDWKDK